MSRYRFVTVLHRRGPRRWRSAESSNHGCNMSPTLTFAILCKLETVLVHAFLLLFLSLFGSTIMGMIRKARPYLGPNKSQTASRTRSNSGITDFLFCQGYPGWLEQESCCKGWEETSEERDPREVKGSHVGVGKRKELEYFGLMFRINWQMKLCSCISRDIWWSNRKGKSLFFASYSMHRAAWRTFNICHSYWEY